MSGERSRGTPPCTPAPTKQDKQQIQKAKWAKRKSRKIQQCSCWLLAKTSISFKKKKNNKQVDHAKSQAGTDLELGPSHGHVDPVGVRPPSQVLVVVRVVHRVVELVVDLGKPESGKLSANLRKLRSRIFDRTQQRFGEA